MSLEQAIMRNTEMLGKIYALLLSSPNTVPPITAMPESEQKPAEAKPAVKSETPKKSVPAATIKPETIKPNAITEEVPAQVPAEPQAQQVSSLEEAITLTIQLGRKSYQAAKAILLKYTATNAREVPEDQRSAYIQDIKNALSE